MKRSFFWFGIALASAGVFLLGAALYLGRLTDPLLHVLAGMIAVGAFLAALMADGQALLSVIDRIVSWRKKSAG